MNAPSRLWSLREMLNKYSAKVSMLQVGLHDMKGVASRNMRDGKEPAIDKANIETIKPWLHFAAEVAGEVDLDAATPLLGRMIEACDASLQKAEKKDDLYAWAAVHADVVNLMSRIEDQLESRLFYYVNNRLAPYYNNPNLFGDKVGERFPGAITDTTDAGKC